MRRRERGWGGGCKKKIKSLPANEVTPNPTQTPHPHLPPDVFRWRRLFDFFWIALAFQSDLNGEIDSITMRLSLSSLLWYNCLYC